MTILLTEGFDMYNGIGPNTGLQARWNLTTTSNVSMQAGRFGGQCLRIVNTGFGTMPNATAAFASGASICVGMGFKVDSVPVNALNSFSLMLFDAAGGVQIGLLLNTDGSIGVYRATATNSGVLLGTTPINTILSNTWHYLELGVTISTSAGVVNLNVDGASKLALTGQNTQNSANANAGQLRLAPTNGGQASAMGYQFDDLYIIDSATPIGERRIETLRAASDISKTWTPDTGTTNFSRVNETLVDGDTSYVQGTSIGDRDLYAIGTLSSTPASIDAVNIVSFAEKTDALTRQIFNSVQSAGTDSDGPAINLAGSYGRFDRIIPLDPHGGGAWTASRVNGLFIGPKVAA